MVCEHMESLDALNRFKITKAFSLRAEEFLESENENKSISYPKVGWVESKNSKSKHWECLLSPTQD